VRVATGDESDKPNTMLVDVDAGRSGKRTYMFEAESVKECDLWLSALRKVAKADTPEHVERRTESTAVRRSAAFGPAIRTLFKNFDAKEKGAMSSAAVVNMYKSLIAGFEQPNIEDAVGTIETNAQGLIQIRPFVDFVVRQFADSVLFDDRLKSASAIKPLFQVDDSGPDLDSQSSDEALKTLFDKMDEDSEGAVAKSEAFDVFMTLLPQFDMKAVREEYEKTEEEAARTINKEQFVAFVLAKVGDETDGLAERIVEAARDFD